MELSYNTGNSVNRSYQSSFLQQRQQRRKNTEINLPCEQKEKENRSTSQLNILDQATSLSTYPRDASNNTNNYPSFVKLCVRKSQFQNNNASYQSKVDDTDRDNMHVNETNIYLNYEEWKSLLLPGTVQSNSKKKESLSSKKSLSSVLKTADFLLESNKLSLVNKYITSIDVIPIKFQDVAILYLGNNSLSCLSGLNQFKNLEVLSLNNNLIRYLDSLEPLSELKRLKRLNLVGNVVCNLPYYRSFVISICKQLYELDGIVITSETKQHAEYEWGRGQNQMKELSTNNLKILLLENLHRKMQLHFEMCDKLFGKYRVFRSQFISDSFFVNADLAEVLRIAGIGGVFRVLLYYLAEYITHANQDALQRVRSKFGSKSFKEMNSSSEGIVRHFLVYQQQMIYELLDECEKLVRQKTPQMLKKTVAETVQVLDFIVCQQDKNTYCGVGQHFIINDSILKHSKEQLADMSQASIPGNSICTVIENVQNGETSKKYKMLLCHMKSKVTAKRRPIEKRSINHDVQMTQAGQCHADAHHSPIEIKNLDSVIPQNNVFSPSSVNNQHSAGNSQIDNIVAGARTDQHDEVKGNETDDIDFTKNQMKEFIDSSILVMQSDILRVESTLQDVDEVWHFESGFPERLLKELLSTDNIHSPSSYFGPLPVNWNSKYESADSLRALQRQFEISQRDMAVVECNYKELFECHQFLANLKSKSELIIRQKLESSKNLLFQWECTVSKAASENSFTNSRFLAAFHQTKASHMNLLNSVHVNNFKIQLCMEFLEKTRYQLREIQEKKEILLSTAMKVSKAAATVKDDLCNNSVGVQADKLRYLQRVCSPFYDFWIFYLKKRVFLMFKQKVLRQNRINHFTQKTFLRKKMALLQNILVNWKIVTIEQRHWNRAERWVRTYRLKRQFDNWCRHFQKRIQVKAWLKVRWDNIKRSSFSKWIEVNAKNSSWNLDSSMKYNQIIMKRYFKELKKLSLAKSRRFIEYQNIEVSYDIILVERIFKKWREFSVFCTNVTESRTYFLLQKLHNKILSMIFSSWLYWMKAVCHDKFKMKKKGLLKFMQLCSSSNISRRKMLQSSEEKFIGFSLRQSFKKLRSFAACMSRYRYCSEVISLNCYWSQLRLLLILWQQAWSQSRVWKKLMSIAYSFRFRNLAQKHFTIWKLYVKNRFALQSVDNFWGSVSEVSRVAQPPMKSSVSSVAASCKCFMNRWLKYAQKVKSLNSTGEIISNKRRASTTRLIFYHLLALRIRRSVDEQQFLRGQEEQLQFSDKRINQISTDCLLQRSGLNALNYSIDCSRLTLAELQSAESVCQLELSACDNNLILLQKSVEETELCTKRIQEECYVVKTMCHSNANSGASLFPSDNFAGDMVEFSQSLTNRMESIFVNKINCLNLIEEQYAAVLQKNKLQDTGHLALHKFIDQLTLLTKKANEALANMENTCNQMKKDRNLTANTLMECNNHLNKVVGKIELQSNIQHQNNANVEKEFHFLSTRKHLLEQEESQIVVRLASLNDITRNAYIKYDMAQSKNDYAVMANTTEVIGKQAADKYWTNAAKHSVSLAELNLAIEQPPDSLPGNSVPDTAVDKRINDISSRIRTRICASSLY